MKESLKAGSVLVAGLGATGTAAALYLAAAGVGRVSLWDPNLVTPTDAAVGLIPDLARVGMPRARSAAWALSAIAPATTIEMIERESDVAGRIPEHQVVIASLGDWPDLDRGCRQSGSLLVLCSAHGAEGAVAAFGPQGPCLSCLEPERARSSGLYPEESRGPARSAGAGGGAAVGSGGLAGAAGVVGAIAATEAVKALLGMAVPLAGRLLTYDAARAGFEALPLERRPDCPECGSRL